MEARVCYFGRNAAMMALVGQQLKAAGIEARGFMDESALRAALEEGQVRLLVMGGGVEDAPRARMKALCAERGVLVLEHHAGPASLPDTIAQALAPKG